LVKCTACKWYCVVPEGTVGICGVRANIGGKLYLLVYNRPSSVAIDPIEKKPLFHVLPGSRIFSIGTVGCNFECKFCQNWEISQTPKILKKQLIAEGKTKDYVETIMEFIDKVSGYLPVNEVPKILEEYGLHSIAFTYNEPTIFVEYAYDVMRQIESTGKNVLGVFVSSGYESDEALNLVKDYIHAYNIDIKGPDDKFYKEYTGGIDFNKVLDTVKKLKKQNKWVEVTTLLIPEANLNRRTIKEIATFIKEVDPYMPWHLSAFYPAYKMLNTRPATPQEVLQAYEWAKEEGLHYVYTGNIVSEQTQSTYCHNCGNLLIARRGYSVSVEGIDLAKGTCKKCKATIPGIWNLGQIKKGNSPKE